MMQRSKLPGVLFALLAAGWAHGQAEVERFDRQLEQIRRQTTSVPTEVPPGQRALFDYGAFVSFNYISLDDQTGRPHGLRQYEIFPFAQLNLDSANEVYVRGRMGYRDWNSGESLDGRGDELIDGDLDRGFYRFDLRTHESAYAHRDLSYNITVKAGRDLAYWANGLTLSEVIDGAAINIDYGGFDAQILAGVTPTRTVDFDFTRPNFDHNTNRGFYGAILGRQIGVHHPFVYGLMQRDYNEDSVGEQNGITTVYEYNSYYIGAGSTGTITDRLLYGVEVTYESGQTLSNSFTPTLSGLHQEVQTEDPIQAFAADVRLDYLLNDIRQSRLTAEAIIASGDDDRLLNSSGTFGGNARNTSDRAFNAFGLLNTGLAFGPQVSNLIALRLGGVTFPAPDVGPFKRLQAGVDLFFFGKLDRNAPINEPTTDSRYLGAEPDLFINWQITSDITVAFRYGVFFPGSAIIDEDDSPRQFIGAGVTYAF